MSLLVYGNAKLGAISNFALPAKHTCPGQNKFCDKYCYGVKNWYRAAHVKKALDDKFSATIRPDFTEAMTKEIEHGKPKVVRIHTVGDFYNEEYIRKWSIIIDSCPTTQFYGYTRAWRVPILRDRLESLILTHSNIVLRASVDFTHQDRPDGWRLFSVVDGEGIHCPHDLGKVAYCRDCGICWTEQQAVFIRVRWAKLWQNFSEELL